MLLYDDCVTNDFAGNDFLSGGSGSDTLSDNLGDSLDGGTEANSMNAGAGNDTVQTDRETW